MKKSKNHKIYQQKKVPRLDAFIAEKLQTFYLFDFTKIFQTMRNIVQMIFRLKENRYLIQFGTSFLNYLKYRLISESFKNFGPANDATSQIKPRNY